jgi:23S rRNA (uracil1939-C5)-methyltransferase
MEVLIERMGAGGDGIATGPIYVPQGLPGERLHVEINGKRGDGALATIHEILNPSLDRIAPACAHFMEGCGGCALQHWAPAPQAAWKRERLRVALARGGFAEAPVAETITTPPGVRRRADFAIRRGTDGLRLGFHAAGSAAILDISACPVLHPRLVAVLKPLRDLLPRLPALKRDGSAVLNLLDTGPDLLLRTDGTLDAAGRALLAGFAAAQGLPRIAWARGNGVPEIAAQLGPVAITLSGVAVTPAPGAFLQASPEGEQAIITAMLAGLPAKLAGRGRIADLHAGFGTLSLALARRGRVTAFESDGAAVAALANAAAKAGLPLAATRRDLVRQPLTVAELAPFAAVVLDPPFAGAEEQAGLLARSAVPAVIYVSCNPQALARDLRFFADQGWRVDAATPIDQFLWSGQLEAVIALSRPNKVKR